MALKKFSTIKLTHQNKSTKHLNLIRTISCGTFTIVKSFGGRDRRHKRPWSDRIWNRTGSPKFSQRKTRPEKTQKKITTKKQPLMALLSKFQNFFKRVKQKAKLCIPGFGESRRREWRKARVEGKGGDEAKGHDAKQRRAKQKNMCHHIRICVQNQILYRSVSLLSYLLQFTDAIFFL